MSAAWPYPAPADDGAAAHLVPGLALPDISLMSTVGGAIALARLDRPAVFFIYPWTGRPGLADPPRWDDIPGAHGSTPEAKGFAALYSEFTQLGFDVFGMSGQDTEHQREFALRVCLPFLLLSDHRGELGDALRLPRFETGGVRYLKRLTLIVQAGKVARVFYPVHPPDTHAAAVLDAVRSYKTSLSISPTS